MARPATECSVCRRTQGATNEYDMPTEDNIARTIGAIVEKYHSLMSMFDPQRRVSH